MSRRRMATIGLAGLAKDAPPGHDVDARTGRLLTVAELQRALAVALTMPSDGATDAPSAPVEVGMDSRQGTDSHSGSMPSADPAETRPDAPGSTTGKEPEPTDHEDAGRRWGAAPVPVGSTGDRPVPVARIEERTRESTTSRWPRFAADELLHLPPRDRRRRATQVLAAGWGGSRRVLVASLSGGVGRSTVAAAVAGAAATAGIAALLLDATGLEESPAAVRVGTDGVSRRPWTWAMDPDSVVDLAALRRRASDSTVSVVALAGDRGTAPPADAVAAAAAAASGFPLVVVDLPTGAPAARAAVGADGSEGLLLLVCRPDPAEVDAAAECVEHIDSEIAGVNGTADRRSVLVVTADRRGLSRPVRRRLAAAARSVAGVVVVPRVPALRPRGAAVTGEPVALAAGAVLAAAAVAGGDRPSQELVMEGITQC